MTVSPRTGIDFGDDPMPPKRVVPDAERIARLEAEIAVLQDLVTRQDELLVKQDALIHAMMKALPGGSVLS